MTETNILKNVGDEPHGGMLLVKNHKNRCITKWIEQVPHMQPALVRIPNLVPFAARHSPSLCLSVSLNYPIKYRQKPPNIDLCHLYERPNNGVNGSDISAAVVVGF